MMLGVCAEPPRLLGDGASGRNGVGSGLGRSEARIGFVPEMALLAGTGIPM